ncbi:cobalt-precorrin-3B C(17)-methyltransferase [Fervidicella metallireducens AeB]|uniref:Cobalt-precorrin-3B C(17)-methyltransferase n=1 Tax=Fervidicella metallireducens AeB TaxID=1403537 RepID=A0A017RZ62_9CLOT|nr:precorrin-3B C(17)-methyltransferase [Fervidicella metallireducens]EYE89230.1 cobalt-precorrin-3B C(17)-methyltransferase [Fervidicella metallireducens AeB]
MAKLYVVGIGPGGKEHMTQKALETIKRSDVIVGYTFYIELINDFLEGKKVISTGMKGELERCKAAIEEVKNGFDTCIISTGDPGLYGMAGPILEMADGIEVEVIPGVSAAFCGASELGAPIMHDFCTISLSDLLTPWELIEKRLDLAAEADFVIALYNPKSMGRQTQIERAVEIIKRHKKGSTPVGLIKNAGREGNEKRVYTLDTIDFDFIDMMTVVVIGNSKTYINNDKIITPRGYSI